MVSSPAPEPRPRVHVTPRAGWLNDPVGGLLAGGRHHLFFQSVPWSTRWQAGCSWGHLVGTDLVRWQQVPDALSPGGGDDGVWSGSAVLDRSGPVLVYTSVVRTDLALGRVALARSVDPGYLHWRKAGEPVLRPPAAWGLTAFRDPYVYGTPGDWRMVLGAGLKDRGGAALLYRSPDLLSWSEAGCLADSGGPDRGFGQVWECPNYVDLDGRRALIVSVWERGRLDRVAASLGAEVGGRFRPGSWQTLGSGGSAYALTTYRDRAGRLAGTAWLAQEDPASPRRGWSGVLSLPVHLAASSDGQVLLAPHPDVDTLRTDRVPADRGRRVDVGATGGVVDLDVHLRPGALLRLEGRGGPVVLTARTSDLLLDRPGRQVQVPAGAAGAEARLRVIVDRGVVEAWTGDGRWIAARIPYLHVQSAAVDGPGRLAAWHLEAVQPSTGSGLHPG